MNGASGLDTRCHKTHECKCGQRGFAGGLGGGEGVDRAWRRERGRFGGQIYCSVEKPMEGGGGSDRLDYESTHRRTLFNVSLTFLVSISSPLTRSRCRDGQEGEGERWERGSGEREAALPLHSNQGHESQTKSRVRVHGRASQSGRARIRFHSAMSPFHSSSRLTVFCVFSSDTRRFPSIRAVFHPVICGLVMKL